MRNLILVPHQDDEMVGCYSLMKLLGGEVSVAVVFKGGGQPKDEVLDEERLFHLRCQETMDACRELGVKEYDFLSIPRGTKFNEVKSLVRDYLKWKKPVNIFTTYPYDNHQEHMILGKIIKQLTKKYQRAYGFIVQTDYLKDFASQHYPDIRFKLNTSELGERQRLICMYKTQSHFLPNIIKRPEYEFERYWRITK